MLGASTSPEAHVFAMAAAQVKKGLEVTKKLGGAGFGEARRELGIAGRYEYVRLEIFTDMKFS